MAALLHAPKMEDVWKRSKRAHLNLMYTLPTMWSARLSQMFRCSISPNLSTSSKMSS